MMADPREQALKSTDWLAGTLGRADLRILGGSFHLPGSRRGARAGTRRPAARIWGVPAR